jgi:peroxiredoxin
MHRAAIKAYGLFHPGGNISQRATVLINKDGKVAWVHVEPDITKERDYKELEAQLAKLA